MPLLRCRGLAAMCGAVKLRSSSRGDTVITMGTTVFVRSPLTGTGDEALHEVALLHPQSTVTQ